MPPSADALDALRRRRLAAAPRREGIVDSTLRGGRVDELGHGAIVEVQHGLHTVSEMHPAEPGHAATPASSRPRWGAFGLVCLAYLGVTVGEQALSPVMPEVAAEFGVTEGQSGLAFGLLALSIAAANLVGGAVLGRFGARALMLAGLAATTAGSVVAALAEGFAVVVAAQVLLGAGAGLYFPAGLQAVPAVAGSGRRGFAMGIYGVAFSAGLTVAAVLGALGAANGWRIAFWCAAALATAAFVATWPVRLGPPSGASVSMRFPAKAVPGLPTVIGAVGAVCQYGAIPFLTTFAVAEWEPPRRPGGGAARRRAGPLDPRQGAVGSEQRPARPDRQRPDDRPRGRRHRHRLGDCSPAGGRRTPAPPCSPGRSARSSRSPTRLPSTTSARTVRRSAPIAPHRSASVPPPAG